VAVLTLTAHTSKGQSPRMCWPTSASFSPSSCSASQFILLCLPPRLTRAIPASTAHGMLRVVAFILLCIGVQIAWNGLSDLLATVLHP